MKKKKVKITSHSPLPLSIRSNLRRQGLKKQNRYCYAGEVYLKKQVHALRSYADTHHLKFRFDNAYGSRSSGYRQQFFAKHAPDIRNQYYCAYCGKLLAKDKVTVDHLYPIGQVSKDIDLQKEMEKQGIPAVNDIRNLVAACEKCNKEKGSRMGEWIRRGKRGRHKSYWIFRHTMRGIGFTCLVAAAVVSSYVFILPAG